MRYLIDTNVISELRKGKRADPALRSWFAELADTDIYLSVLTLGEIRQGIENIRRRDAEAARSLESWLGRVSEAHANRVLPIDRAIAEEWGRMNVPLKHSQDSACATDERRTERCKDAGVRPMPGALPDSEDAVARSVRRRQAGAGGPESASHPLPVIDGMLAATAKVMGLTVATRNSEDFARSGVDFQNPFSTAS